MQLKNLIKNNQVILADDSMEVTKIIGTPFSLFAEACCQHEARCLETLAQLGFDSAPRLISSEGNSLIMERVSGRSLTGYRSIDEELCLRILEMVQRLHSLGFAHGNLRNSNIFITDSNEPMLIDFETCCRQGSALFPLAKFSDQVRQHLLWNSAFVVPYRKRSGAVFPTHITVSMFFITPINRFAAVLKSIKKSIKKRYRRTRKVSAEQRKSSAKATA